jgi:hypothetical protein
VTAGAGSVQGTRVANLNPETYVLLDIEELNGVQQCAIFGTGGTQGAVFGKVPIVNQQFSTFCYDKQLSTSEFVPAIPKLDRLRVALRWHDGSLVDFAGVEHSFTLELSCTTAR